MPKAKLKFKSKEVQSMLMAADFSNVKTGRAIEVGENVIVEVSYLDLNNVVDMIKLMPTLSEKQVQQYHADKAPKTEQKKASVTK